MISKIVNVYKLKSEISDQASYMYSLKKENDNLGFEYYILNTDNDDAPVIQEAINTITLLQKNGITLIPVEKNTPEYKQFLNNLLIAISNNLETPKIPSRK